MRKALPRGLTSQEAGRGEALGRLEEALAGPSLKTQRGLFWCVDEEKNQPRKRMQSPA